MKNVFLIIFVLIATHSIAQYTISGYVVDSSTNERVIGANLYMPAMKTGTTTNNYGYYSFTFDKADSISIVVSFVGYRTKLLRLHADRNIQMDIQLSQGMYLKEVNITAGSTRLSNPAMGILELPMKQIAFMPKLMGETDIMRVFQLMPGVQVGKEGTSGIYVRGGSPDQNLILLDDIPMYYVNHLGGFISVFNPDAINSVILYKGGFPARYGGRLSSIMDVRMKEGNMKEKTGNFTFGLLSTKLTLEFPLKKDKTSAIISLRRSLFDIITRGYFLLLDPGNKQTAGYTIYDLNAKINHKISEKDHLYFSIYTGHDRLFSKQRDVDNYDGKFKYNSKNFTQWGNYVLSARWNHIYNNRLFGNVTLGYARFFYDISSNASKYTIDGNEKMGEIKSGFNSTVSDGILKADYDYYPSNKHHVKFGGMLIYHTYNPYSNFSKLVEDNVTYSDTAIKSPLIRALEMNLYVEDEVSISENFSINAGLRLAGFWVGRKMYFAPEPRMTGNYMLSAKTSIKASYAYMTQAVHLLSNSGAGLPADLWVPATETTRPESAHQLSLGLMHKLPENTGLELTVEVFYKQMYNLIDFKEGISFFSGTTEWESKIESGGKGKVYGMEVLLEKKQGNTTGWIGYTLSKNTRQFANINSGNAYPYVYDRTHDLSVVVNQHLTDRITLSAIWVYSTGNAITLPMMKNIVANVDVGQSLVHYIDPDFYYSESHIYPGKNNYRMPDYHRLDLSCSFTRHYDKRTTVWSIDIYNAYCRLNPFYVYFDKTKSGDIKLYSFSLFPIIPSFSYSYYF